MKNTILLLTYLALHLSAFANGTIALKDILQKDGTILPCSGLSGTVEFSGFEVELDPCEGPVFKPVVVPGWNALGSGLNGDVLAIAIYGSNIYVGGNFTDAGGIANADYIARWNGSSWNALGSGLNGYVRSVSVNWNGSNVFVGGVFINAGGNANADYVARWDGSNWNAMGTPLNDVVYAVLADGSDYCYAGGWFTNAGGDPDADRIAWWNGSNWISLYGGGLNWLVTELFQGGVAGGVYAGGEFTNAGGNPNADCIARNNGGWYALGSGLNGAAHSIANTSGGCLYVAGAFTDAGGNTNSDYIANWDCNNWYPLGSGLNDVAYAVQGISSSNLFVGGAFTNAGGVTNTTKIAKWDGSNWSALGSGLNGSVYAIAVQGNNVYVGGHFTDAGGNTSGDYIAVWDNTLLPVELIEFNAVAENRQIVVNWRTASETQNAHFFVQHSTDGMAFRDLAKIPGAGNSQVENHYEFLHKNPSHGANYYRLKQVDLDGSFEYSQVVSVEFGAKEMIQLYPNPFSNTLQIDIHTEQDELPARLFDVTGRQVWQGSLRNGQQAVEVAGLQAGVFWMEVDFGNRTERLRVVKN